MSSSGLRRAELQRGAVLGRLRHRAADRDEGCVGRSWPGRAGAGPDRFGTGAGAGSEPWRAENLDPKLLHVAFLSGAPDAARLAAVDHAALLPERLAVGDRSLYLFHAGGVQRSRLARLSFGVDATARNWTTVGTLAGLARLAGWLGDQTDRTG